MYNRHIGFRKRGTKKPVYNNIVFDSVDEIGTYMWLEECLENKLIQGFIYHPDSFKITDPVTKEIKVITTNNKGISKEKTKKITILRESSYTADFYVFGIDKSLFDVLYTKDGCAWIDTKGKWSAKGLGKDGKYFSLVKKIIYKLYGIYINTFMCEDVFKKTFVPEKYRLTEKTKKIKKQFIDCSSIQEFKEKIKDVK